MASACCDCWCRPGYWFIDFSPSSSTSGGYWGCYSCDYGWSRRARQRCRNITLFVLFALMLALVGELTSLDTLVTNILASVVFLMHIVVSCSSCLLALL